MFETLEFYPGKEIEFDLVAKELTEFGYVRQTQTQSPGEFSIRGDILDIYPVHFTLPVRIEFSNETVEGVHTFDPSTGQRLEPHKMVLVWPFKGNMARRAPSQKYALAQGYESPVDPFVDIEVGDTVVHLLHGIAKYRGIKSLKNKSGSAEDHFALEFAEKNVLYVPTRDLHLIQRYIAFGKIRPELSRLGSKTWEKLKDRPREGVLSFAAELLEMQAKREALEGFGFKKDTEWQKKLEDEFPYEETEDQDKAVADVKRDLESPRPMDRLLCGDVGYGKTEVELRAAFKVVMNGKQVAILVPTTLLAEQHFETFGERLKNFPVELRMLSRFQTKGSQKKAIEEVRSGACDIVIGTHRLLSGDLAFKDLGLVIIDEEQRFGVRQKERLKKLRLLVDVL